MPDSGWRERIQILRRFSPLALGGATAAFFLLCQHRESVIADAVDAGALESSPVQDEHGWRLGRVVDPFGHEWEIGHPLKEWPPR